MAKYGTSIVTVALGLSTERLVCAAQVPAPLGLVLIAFEGDTVKTRAWLQPRPKYTGSVPVFCRVTWKRMLLPTEVTLVEALLYDTVLTETSCIE